ncbi:hypothetical protein NXW50_30890 [Bacteroides thetaiotaomicron]|nr:hypothetical protein [Bacteroides thetaiotaomicron]MCS2282374.1 hypothetical protein [Bacteroides thetaiotaomicron]
MDCPLTFLAIAARLSMTASEAGFEAEARVIVSVGQYRAVADSRLAGRKLQFPLQVVG